ARPSSETFVNPAKSLALDLAGSVPLVLGAGDLAGVAALRTAAQLARNARHPAVAGILPDDAAEVVATFDGPFVRGADDLFADPDVDGEAATTMRLVLLRDEPDEEDHDVARVAAGPAAGPTKNIRSATAARGTCTPSSSRSCCSASAASSLCTRACTRCCTRRS